MWASATKVSGRHSAVGQIGRGTAGQARGARRRAIALLLPILPLLAPVASVAQAPPLSQVSDVLGGKRILLSIDNAVVTGSFNVFGLSCDPFARANCLVTPSFYLRTTAPNTLSLFETVLSEAFEGTPYAADVAPTTTNLGRLFNLPQDILVRIQASVVPPNPTSIVTVVLEDLTGTAAGPVIPFPPPYSPPSGAASADVNATVLADFTGDGFDDIATNVGAGTLRIARATDVSNTAAGLTWGPALTTPPFKAMAAGDFDGDGHADLAAVYFDPVANTGRLAVYSVDRVSLAATLRGTIAVPLLGPGDKAALTAGHYTNAGADQLVLVINSAQAKQVELFSFSVDGQFAISLRGTFVAGGTAPELTAKSASLDALGGLTAQVVVGYGDTHESAGDSFEIFGFDGQLNFVRQSLTFLTCASCFRDLAVGNFTQGVTPTLEIAVVTSTLPTSRESAGPIGVSIYQLNASTLAPSLASSYTIPTSNYPSRDVDFLRIAAGDTLGRGMRLGAPSKVTVQTHVQPQVVLGMPPMHVDWAPPVGSKAPTVLNVSAVPSSFFSEYTTQVVSGTQSSSTSTTSYSFGTSTSEGGGFGNQGTFGGASLASFSAMAQSATASAHSNFVAKQYNTFQSQSFDASTHTGTADHVWFTSENFNLFIYPVIGQAACAADQPGCTDDRKLPLAVIFSGPDTTVASDSDGATLEWYQPVHEPFNALSYPANQAQLAGAIDGFSQLAASSVWSTDSAQESRFATWSQQNGSDVTSGSAQTHSRDKTISVGGSIFGLGANKSVDYHSSKAFGTVFSNVTTVGASAGVGVIKPGTFLNPGEYEYPVQNFIFGENNPAGTAQQLSPNTTVQASGALRAGFAADPSGLGFGSAGVWWKQTYSVPDVALNHPVRWTVVSTTSAKGANCLRFSPESSASQCVTFNKPDLGDLPASEFHWMRGFFVTQASANGSGAQTTYATAGDKLLLETRVYNYSLVDMPPGTAVHVRFYGQEMGTNGAFKGASFLIGETTIDPIPGFNSGPAPNWAMASTTFDTAKFPDVSLVFWVLVWMEDPAGRLVPELAGHGLTRKPGPLTSLAAVPIEEFSNNVGYYNQPIYIAPAGAGAALPAPASQVAIEALTPAQPLLSLPAMTVVSANLRASASGESGVLVRFFDGDPARGGRMFDAELVPRIRPGEAWTARVPYHPKTCGTHRLFVVAGSSQSSTVVEVAGTPGTGLDCPLTAPDPFTGSASHVGDGGKSGDVKVEGRFLLAPSSSLDLTRPRVTILSLLTESGGGGELVDLVADGTVALVSRPGGKSTSGTFDLPAAPGSPKVQMTLKRGSGGEVKFSVKVDGAALSERPVFCSSARPSTTSISTRFVIDDGVNAPLEIAAVRPWECAGPRTQVWRDLKAQ